MEVYFWRLFSEKSSDISSRGNSPKWLLIRAFCGLISMGYFLPPKLSPAGSCCSPPLYGSDICYFFAVYLLKETVYRLQILFYRYCICRILILKGFDSQLSGIGFGIILSLLFQCWYTSLSVRLEPANTLWLSSIILWPFLRLSVSFLHFLNGCGPRIGPLGCFWEVWEFSDL